MKTFSLSSIAVLSLIAMSGAHAGDVPTLTVKYADLDLSRTEGAATLYGRISHAARTVCAPLDFVQTAAPMGMGDAYKNCFSNAVSGAVSKIHSPVLSAYVASKTGTPATIKLASR
jgi:UrcA family protein